jgi:hypothetical protein
MTHLVKSEQILRMFLMKTQAKPILMCSLCVRSGHITHLPLNFCARLMGASSKHKLFSTSAVKRLSLETRTKKKIVLSVPEARRLLSLAKPEKWNLLGMIRKKLNIYDVLFTVIIISETKVSTWNLSQYKNYLNFSEICFENLLPAVLVLLHICME